MRRGGPADARGPAGGYTPSVLAAAYRMPDASGPGRGGEAERIGIVEFGGGYRAEDLEAFCDEFGLPFGEVSEVSVGGAGNDYGGKTRDADTEVALDLDWSRAAAPNAPLALVWAPNVDHGWVDVLARILDAPDATRPSVLSISWGMPEDGFSTSRRYDQVRQLFQSATLLGVTFVAASGDNGAPDEPPGTPYFDGQRHVDFPAILPEATAVGGTKLVPGPRGFTETVWNDGARGGASGGGYSRFVKVPEWQKAAVENRGGFTGRGVPDVSAVASPDPGLAVHVHGRWDAVGGTSVAAPIWAGFLAQVNAARAAGGKSRLGAANPALYAIAGKGSPFRDVTSGDNSFGGVEGFHADKGWDPVTGLGSPDVTKLVGRLGK
ncbi:MAG TPA: S53 family peptidase [Thermoanaerobaculia bacterium]|nr:S53 family peptidase [Thermoanaerobaculia bacterium]